MSDAEPVQRAMALSDAQKLAEAVILFHGAVIWGEEQKAVWRALTGAEEATTRVLCDLARRAAGATLDEIVDRMQREVETGERRPGE